MADEPGLLLNFPDAVVTTAYAAPPAIGAFSSLVIGGVPRRTDPRNTSLRVSDFGKFKERFRFRLKSRLWLVDACEHGS